MTADVGDVDRPLLRLVAAGDERAFRRLYDRHVRASRHRALRVLAAPDLMDDVVQPVFLDVWTFAARFDGERGTVRGGTSRRCGGWRYGTPTTTSTSARRWRGRTAGG